MTALLDLVLESHGTLERWREFCIDNRSESRWRGMGLTHRPAGSIPCSRNNSVTARSSSAWIAIISSRSFNSFSNSDPRPPSEFRW
jgi:3-mercaptopyruvate sulfurtransferase SseA